MIDRTRPELIAEIGRFLGGWYPIIRGQSPLLGLLLLLLASVSTAADLPQIVGCEVGLGNTYKLGLTTQLLVKVKGGDEPMPLYVTAIASDTDGVGAATTMLGGKPISTEPGKISEARLYARIGKDDAAIQIRLLRGSKVIDTKSFSPYEQEPYEIASPVNSNSRIWLSLGKKSNLELIFKDQSQLDNEQSLRIGILDTTDEMPLDWIGYEGVDTVWLTAGDGIWIRDLGRNDPRIVALREWVGSGGRLVLSCGSAGAELLGPGAVLSDLLPGTYERTATLRRTSAIEAYAEAKVPINLRGGDLNLSRINAKQTMIVASDGGGEKAIPLVVRNPYGFGEVTFVAFDLDNQALADWPDKSMLLQKLVTNGYKGLGNDFSNNPQFNSMPKSDNNNSNLVRGLIAKLDKSFRGVSTTPFIVIVGLVVAYLLLIGPGDYWLTVSWLKRPEMTWISFPLIVALTSVGAYLAATALKGDQLRVNQIDLMDVDVEASEGRGLAITHMFSPKADRYSLALSVKQPNGDEVTNLQQYSSWLGKPGYGLGAMQGSNGMGATLVADYQWQPLSLKSSRENSETSNDKGSPAILGMPVQVWSTKSMMSRWMGKIGSSLDAKLQWNDDRLVEGIVTNEFGVELTNCRLLAGDWAWRLGNLSNGESAEINTTLAPLKIATILKGIDRGEAVEDYSTKLSLMGSRLNGNRELIGSQLAFCDLSHHLAAGRAILLAECHATPNCQFIHGDKPLASDKDNHWVYCRFILPVEDP